MEVKEGESLQFECAVTCCVALKAGESLMAVALEGGIVCIGDIKVEIK